MELIDLGFVLNIALGVSLGGILLPVGVLILVGMIYLLGILIAIGWYMVGSISDWATKERMK